MLNVSRTAIALALSFTVIASVSDAHMLRNRNFDFADLLAQPFDEIGEMLKGFPDVATGSDAPPDVVDPAPGHALSTPPPENSATPDQPQPTTVGAEVEILNTYNKGGVRHGQARSPTFTLTEPMMLTHLQTYHWNDGQGTAAPGQIGLKGHGPWQAKGRPGMFDTPNAEWIATPQVILQPGPYSVVDSSPETWAHNSSSQELGFVVVRAAPLSGGSKTTKPVTAKLSEREALDQLVPITRFKDWVFAVRANGNSVVYELTSDPTVTCADTSCSWCFRMLEDTPSHRTYFATFCIDANSGKVSAQVE